MSSAAISPDLLASMKAHLDDNDQPQVIAALSAASVVAWVAVLLRFVSRWKSRTRLGWDDYLIVVGLIFETGSIVTTGMMVQFGFGRHVLLVTNRQLLIQNIIAAECLYNATIPPVKISILFLYRRLFPSPILNRLEICTAVFVLCYTIVQLVCIVVQCLPIRSFWTDEPASCINFAVVLMLCSIFNILTDVVILVMPIPYIWNLKVKRSKRFQLMATFGLGGVVTGITIVRTIIVSQGTSPDKTWVDVGATIISEVELAIGILSACLPTYRPLFYSRTAKKPTGSSGYVSAPQSKYSNRSGRAYAKGSLLGSQTHTNAPDNWLQLDNMDEPKSISSRSDNFSRPSNAPIGTQSEAQGGIHVRTDVRLERERERQRTRAGANGGRLNHHDHEGPHGARCCTCGGAKE